MLIRFQNKVVLNDRRAGNWGLEDYQPIIVMQVSNFYYNRCIKLDCFTFEKLFSSLVKRFNFLSSCRINAEIYPRRTDPRSKLSIKVTLSKFSSSVNSRIFRFKKSIYKR